MAVLIFSTASYAQGGSKLVVKVIGVRSTKGQVLVAVYNSEKGFPVNQKRSFRASGAVIEGNTATVVFENLVPGTYAVVTSHDENGNGKIDTNFIGMPKEGVAVSNNPEPSGPPSFKDSNFELNGAAKTITMKINY